MTRNYELDALKAREQELFERKQGAWNVYADLREHCSGAHDAMGAAWRE